MKKWINARLIICSLIFLLACAAGAYWWAYGVPSGAMGILIFTFMGLGLVSFILAFIVGRSNNLAASLIFLAIVTVLMIFYPDFSKNTLVAIAWHSARGPLVLHPLYPMLGLLGAGSGMVAGNKEFSAYKRPTDPDTKEPEK